MARFRERPALGVRSLPCFRALRRAATAGLGRQTADPTARDALGEWSSRWSRRPILARDQLDCPRGHARASRSGGAVGGRQHDAALRDAGGGPSGVGRRRPRHPSGSVRQLRDERSARCRAPPDAVERLLDSSAGDLGSRFLPVPDAWEAIRLTGYGEAVRLIAREIYGLEELTVDGLEAAQVTLTSLRRPGERLRLLRDVARLDHVQVDDFDACVPAGRVGAGLLSLRHLLGEVGQRGRDRPRRVEPRRAAALLSGGRVRALRGVCDRRQDAARVLPHAGVDRALG